MRWTSNNNATQEKWLSDRNVCYDETEQQMASQSIDQSKMKVDSVDSLVCRTFNACLAARGYTRSDATGALTVPGTASVVCAAPNR